MSLLNAARSKLSDMMAGVGEETLTTIEDDGVEEEEVQLSALPRKKREKPKRTKTTREPRSKKEKSQRFKPVRGPKSKQEKPEKKEHILRTKTVVEDEEETADFFLDQDLFGNEEEATERSVSDILAILQIEDAIRLPRHIMLPEDFKHPGFDKSTPVGYDFSQVDTFLAQARSSIQTLIDLHDERNKDIVTLAEYADRLQADNKELIYNAELAQGVSILPTQNFQEEELAEAQMRILGLEAELRRVSGNAKSSSSAEIAMLKDTISILEGEKEELKAEIDHLKSQIILLESDAAKQLHLNIANSPINDEEDYFDEDFFKETQKGANRFTTNETLPLLDDSIHSTSEEQSLPPIEIDDDNRYGKGLPDIENSESLPSLEDLDIPGF